MVRVGFIVEGESEKMLMESVSFRDWCSRIGIETVTPIINAGGGGGLLPEFFQNYEKRLSTNGRPDKIVVLTDREKAPTNAVVKKRILRVNEMPTGGAKKKKRIDYVFVSVKALEAWFLADDKAMSSWLKATFHEDFPERTAGMPWDRIREIAAHRNRGPGENHLSFAKTLINSHGFTIENAARHPHCPSVQEFYRTLGGFGEETSQPAARLLFK